MFIFGNEEELVDYIISNKDKYPQLKDKTIIGGERYYGNYTCKNKSIHAKISDLVFLDEKAIYFCEVRCEYISPGLIEIGLEAVQHKAFYKEVKVLFIGTKISDRVEKKVSKHSSIEYLVLEDVQYIKGYKTDKEISKEKYQKNIELLAYYFLNNARSLRFNIERRFSKYDIKSYKIINKSEIELYFKIKQYYLKVVINIIRYRNEYLIEIIEKNSNDYCTILSKKTNLYYHQVYEMVYNMCCFLKNVEGNYLDNKNIEDIFDIIVYCSFNKNRHKDFYNEDQKTR